MFEIIKKQLLNPVTSTINSAKEEDLKKGAIKLAIISAVMSLVNVISTIASIFSRYSSKGFYGSFYDKDTLKEKKWDAIKDAELFGAFFKVFLVVAAVIAVMALVLWIISKLVKNPKKYEETLSMINNFMITIVAGIVLKMLISLIYAPLGILVMIVISIYAGYTLIYSYRDSLEVENTDKLVLVTTGVFTALIIVAIILLCAVTDISLSDIADITDLIKMF